MRFASAALTMILALALTGCASGPDIRANYDGSVDFSQYKTYGFVSQLGTDRAGYESLVTRHFKEAVRTEMDALGYRYVEEDPDLMVNFYGNSRERTDVRTTPSPTVSAGYYGYRGGMYTAWPMYQQEVRTVTYEVGTVNIDVVDEERRQLVWEGVAEGRLKKEVLENPKPAIDRVVRELFSRFPTATGN